MSIFQIKDGKFQLNGKKFNIYSGAIHYFRILPHYWRDRLKKLKAIGFNTVETYVAWNMHEQKEGVFSFEGLADLGQFLQIAQEEGLYAIVRPGPFICAEFDFGGFPSWILKNGQIPLRCDEEPYISYVMRWFDVLLPYLKKHLITNGGNVLMLQIENEYGYWGNDTEYLEKIRDCYVSHGLDVPFFTSDGTTKMLLSGGNVEGALPALNFGSRVYENNEFFKNYFNNQYPMFCSEFWCGWFDSWGGEHHTRETESVVSDIQKFLEVDGNFNIYMFCGGTNFGFTAGALNRTMPFTTSYDYCALLNEYGDYTPTYFAVRNLMKTVVDVDSIPLPPSPVLQNIGTVTLTERATLKANKNIIGATCYSKNAKNMEQYGLNNGIIEYEITLGANYQKGIDICINGISDIAYIYENNTLIGSYVQRKDKDGGYSGNYVVKKQLDGATTVRICVAPTGRVNFGMNIGTDAKGIREIVLKDEAGQQRVYNYKVTCYPLDNLEKLVYDGGEETPCFLKGKFKAEPYKDTFVYLPKFTRGYVFVNGFNLGRYDNDGPQMSLYLPGALLKEENEIVVLELENVNNATVEIKNEHCLSKK